MGVTGTPTGRRSPRCWRPSDTGGRGDWNLGVGAAVLLDVHRAHEALPHVPAAPGDALGRDIDAVTQEVRDRVASILSDLPPGTEPPLIAKIDNDSAPVLTVAVSGERTLRELTEIADRRVRRALERASGVPFHDLVRQRVCEPGDFRCLTRLDADWVIAAAERALGQAHAS